MKNKKWRRERCTNDTGHIFLFCKRDRLCASGGTATLGQRGAYIHAHIGQPVSRGDEVFDDDAGPGGPHRGNRRDEALADVPPLPTQHWVVRELDLVDGFELLNDVGPPQVLARCIPGGFFKSAGLTGRTLFPGGGGGLIF